MSTATKFLEGFNKSLRDQKQNSTLLTGVFLLFLGLKLAGVGQVAHWSWWWVTAPLWGPIALAMGILILGVGGLLLYYGLQIAWYKISWWNRS